jgi:hypothetical protein
MAKIKVTRPIRFTPGTSYEEKINMPVGVQDLGDEHLDHPYIKQLVDEGAIVLLEAPNSVEISIDDMTVAQLKDEILKTKPDFDLKPIKVKADYIAVLKALKAEGEKTDPGNESGKE